MLTQGHVPVALELERGGFSSRSAHTSSAAQRKYPNTSKAFPHHSIATAGGCAQGEMGDLKNRR